MTRVYLTSKYLSKKKIGSWASERLLHPNIDSCNMLSCSRIRGNTCKGFRWNFSLNTTEIQHYTDAPSHPYHVFLTQINVIKNTKPAIFPFSKISISVTSITHLFQRKPHKIFTSTLHPLGHEKGPDSNKSAHPILHFFPNILPLTPFHSSLPFFTTMCEQFIDFVCATGKSEATHPWCISAIIAGATVLEGNFQD